MTDVTYTVTLTEEEREIARDLLEQWNKLYGYRDDAHKAALVKLYAATPVRGISGVATNPVLVSEMLWEGDRYTVLRQKAHDQIDGMDYYANIYLDARYEIVEGRRPPAAPAEPPPLDRLEAWLRQDDRRAFLNREGADYNCQLWESTFLEGACFAPTLAAALDAALQQVQEEQP